jgi:sulfite exporter TauE/SafE
MPVAELTAAFLLALLGGLHCAGMCGGFVGMMYLPGQRAAALRVTAALHAGRVLGYTLAGALAGGLGGALYAAGVRPLQVGLLVLGSLMLLAVGASLLGRGRWLRSLEPAGVWLWSFLGPLARRVLPPRTARQALLAGMAWGWIPCGMVYAALPLALVAGGTWQGAIVMLAFGLGTLPNVALIDAAARGMHGLAQRHWLRWVRPLAGAVVVVFGISGLAHAARIGGADHPAIVQLASLCHGVR